MLRHAFKCLSWRQALWILGFPTGEDREILTQKQEFDGVSVRE